MARSTTQTRRASRRKTDASSRRSPAKKAKRTSRTTKTVAKKVAKPTRTTGRKRKTSVKTGKLIRSYQTAMDYLNSRINYERRPMRRQERGMLTLDRMKRLLKDLDNPQNEFRTVHIAGSKGKGSTATMLAQMLIGNGLKVGLFTSPHILDIRERIVINDEMVTKPALTKLIARISEVSAKYGKEEPTYFEVLTAAAFLHFADRQVDVAVIETGLGGRFDATNVIKPEACAITNISLDHTPELGNSLESIAAEKAGVFKAKVPVVSAPQTTEVKKVLKNAAEASGSDLHFAGDDIRFSYRFESSRNAGPQARICVTTPTSHFDHLLVPLVGEHQAENCGVALGLLDQLKNRGFELNDESSINGLSNVRLQGRMEMLCDKPRVLGDGAHNAASIEALMRAIGQNVPYDSMVVIFGCMADKDIEGMLKLIRLGADKVIFTRVKSPRTADPETLASAFTNISGRMAQVAPNLADALEIAEKAVTREDLICITGSFYLVSEAKEHFGDHPHRAMSILVQTA